MLYACAKLGHRPPLRFLQLVEGRIRRFLTLGDSFLPVDICQSIWAFGRWVHCVYCMDIAQGLPALPFSAVDPRACSR